MLCANFFGSTNRMNTLRPRIWANVYYDCRACGTTVAAPFLRRFLLRAPPESPATGCPVCSSASNLFLFPPVRSRVSSCPETLNHLSPVARPFPLASSCFVCLFLTLSGFGPFGPFFFLRGGSTLLLGWMRARSEAGGRRACSSVYTDYVHQHN